MCLVNNHVKSVTWPCLFQLTTSLAQDANVTKRSIVSIGNVTYKLLPLAVVNGTQLTDNSLT